MKKKIILLFVMMLITSGCEIEYNLEINGDNYNENTTVIGNTLDASENLTELKSKVLYDEYMPKPIPLFNDSVIQSESNEPIEGVLYYEKEDLADENIVGVQFNGTFDSNNINNSTIINYAYGNFEIIDNENQIAITTDKKFKLFDQQPNLDKVIINIKTNYKVIESNADEVNNNIYTWNINKNNYTDKPINIVMEKHPSQANSNINNASVELFIIIGSIVIVLVLIGLYIKFKTNKNNKI